MPVDKDAASWLKWLEESGLPPLNEMTIADARTTFANVVAQCGRQPETVADIADRNLAGPYGDVPVRVYTPAGSGPFPLLMYFHGGGWVLGDLDSVHGPCTVLANRAQAVVVSVDYHLAPEHTFPAAVDDCYSATKWAADNASLLNADPERLAVGGDSAGGTLAAVVSLIARDRRSPALMCQLLIYPATEVNSNTDSYRQNGDGYFLTADLMQWFYDHYLNAGAEKDDWRASPLRVQDASELPPALVITAEYDPLRDEAEAYAARMVEGGVIVTTKRYAGQIHGFTANLAGVMGQGEQSLEHAGKYLRQVFRAGWEPQLWL